MRFNYTNSDCFENLKCRLHCFDEEKNIRGVLYKGHIKSTLFTYFAMSSLLEIFKEKKIGVFCHRDILINGYSTKSINGFFTAGYFVKGIYLNRVISYYLIVQSRFSKGYFDSGYSEPGLFYTC
jgi:hypothetical protein